MSLSGLKREAQDRGLRWADVWAAYQELKAQEWEKRQRPNEIRSSAWCMATASTPSCWPFWRHGLQGRYGRRYDLGDCTAIPGYDEIAQQIATEFPEYATDDGTERLWEFLMSPYDKLPDRETLLRRAMDRVEGSGFRVQGSEHLVPF